MNTSRHVSVFVLLLGLSVPAYADFITFSSRSTFNSSVPGLPVETFEAGLVAPGGITLCAGPLSSSAASACFPLGGLLPGVVYSAAPNGSMVVIGGGFPPVGNASKVLGPNFFADTFNMTFTAPITAVGFDVFPGPIAGNIAIALFSPANTPLTSFTFAGSLGANFFGVISTTDLIGRVNIASLAPTPGELVDNVAFGTPVPEPSSLVLLAGGLGVLFGLQYRRKRAHRGRAAPAE
jgi:PEP-CTERM motif